MLSVSISFPLADYITSVWLIDCQRFHAIWRWPEREISEQRQCGAAVQCRCGKLRWAVWEQNECVCVWAVCAADGAAKAGTSPRIGWPRQVAIVEEWPQVTCWTGQTQGAKPGPHIFSSAVLLQNRLGMRAAASAMSWRILKISAEFERSAFSNVGLGPVTAFSKWLRCTMKVAFSWPRCGPKIIWWHSLWLTLWD